MCTWLQLLHYPPYNSFFPPRSPPEAVVHRQADEHAHPDAVLHPDWSVAAERAVQRDLAQPPDAARLVYRLDWWVTVLCFRVIWISCRFHHARKIAGETRENSMVAFHTAFLNLDWSPVSSGLPERHKITRLVSFYAKYEWMQYIA